MSYLPKSISSKHYIPFRPKNPLLASPTNSTKKCDRTVIKSTNPLPSQKLKLNNFINGSKSMKNKFNQTSFKRFQEIFYKPRGKLNPQKLKSYDKITKNPQCQLKRFYNKINEFTEDQKQEFNTYDNSKSFSSSRVIKSRYSMNRRNTKPMSKIIPDLQLLRQASGHNAAMFKKNFSIEKSIKPIQKKDILANNLDEKILAYLKRNLSSIITESVYFKDYFKLFKKYKDSTNQTYQYRSKSDSRLLDKGSYDKRRANDYCLFTDYLYNIYASYNIIKEQKTKVRYMMNKNILFYNEIDRLNANNVNLLNGVQNSSSRMVFNFFAMNKYLKEFSKFIKRFNKTSKISYVEDIKDKEVKELQKKKELKPDISKYGNMTEVDLNIIQKPINNMKNANLFRKIVQHTVESEKQQVRKNMFKKKLNNCFQKSIFIIKCFGKRNRSVKEPEPSKLSTSKNKNVCVDIGKVYKMPKTIDIKIFTDNVKNELKTTNRRFKLKSLSRSRDPCTKKQLNASRRN